MVFSRFRFTNKSSLEKDLRGGMVIDPRYFGQKRHQFSIEQLAELYEQNSVLMVKRPLNYRLFGNIVVSVLSASNKKMRGVRENDQGLAFMQHSDVQSNVENAEKYFLQSANMGYSKGQLNLARLYLTSNRINEALNWLKKSALQGNEQAIKLYWNNCNDTENCDVSSFEQALSDSGFVVK
jgi:TPR repeat protein